ncbi:MAG TPA: HAD family phosphatase [Mycobacteriales bacterium]|jgi:epoxide hydrolase-like predicted phosphatase|nr:HAD family phosphatase [Mycobacteriales bacterium]
MSEVRALVVDYGGVLTSPLNDAMTSWCDADGIDVKDFRRVMKEWLGSPYGDEAVSNPVHALERGEIDVPDFERELASRLRTRDGQPIESTGLLTRMFSGFYVADPPIARAVRLAKAAGFATGLLSNSWGLDYPRDGWDELFDAVVISGEVGMRKPEPEIYRLTADRLGLAPQQCVFVDDLLPNVRGAVDAGMVGVHHVTPQQTLEELEALFEVPLR